MLNAPEVTLEKHAIFETEQMIPSKVAIHDPSYIIEEFAHRYVLCYFMKFLFLIKIKFKLHDLEIYMNSIKFALRGI